MTKSLYGLPIEKKEAIQNYIDWMWKTKGEEIKKQAIGMYLECPDPEYWTEERMKEFMNRYERKHKLVGKN